MESILICTYDDHLVPHKKTEGAICRDMKINQDITIEPQQLIVVSTGFKTRIPLGRQAKVYARSGLPVNHGLMLANSVAVFDADYRGEYFIQVFNFRNQPIPLPQYSRLTQVEFLPAYLPEQLRYGTQEVPPLEIVVDKHLFETFDTQFPTDRGNGKFNSTGLT